MYNQQKNKSYVLIQSLLLLSFNLIGAILFPLIINYATNNSLLLTDEIILGFLFAITLVLIELLFYIKIIHSLKIEHTKLWKYKNEIDLYIFSIRNSMHTIIDDENKKYDFFYEHYKYELGLIRKHLEDTLTRNEIIIERNHIENTNTLLSLYNERKHNIFRATHLLWLTDDTFDVTYKFYFEAWLEKLNNGKVKTIQRLFVYKDLEDFNIMNARKLLAFHNANKNIISTRIISQQELSRFKADFNILDGVEDFGIFSNVYVYLGKTRNADNISGVFSQDQEKINTYIQMFESLWNSPTTQPITDYISDEITLTQLFDNEYSLPKKV